MLVGKSEVGRQKWLRIVFFFFLVSYELAATDGDGDVCLVILIAWLFTTWVIDRLRPPPPSCSKMINQLGGCVWVERELMMRKELVG